MGLFRETPEQKAARLARRAEGFQKIRDNQAARKAAHEARAFKGLKIDGDQISYQGEGGPLAGARATVESEGDIDRRITATRLILTGPFALGMRKKRDTRQLYLTVEGVGFGFVVEVHPSKSLEARRLAAQINAASTA